MNTATKAPWVKKLEDARDIAKAAEGAARELTDDERTKISTLFAEAQGEKAQSQAQAKTAREIEQVGELLKAEEAGELNEAALNGATTGLKGRPASPGRAFVKSNDYQDLMSRNPNGLSAKAALSMGTVQVPGGVKSLLTSSGQTGSDVSNLIEPQRLGIVDYPYVAPVLRDVITTAQTTSDKIEYAQVIRTEENGVTKNAAKGVKEAPSTTGGVGVKPESALGFRKASADVITIAHWMPVTRKTLSDAAQIRSMIDAFLTRGLAEEVDRLILSGDKDTPTKGEEEWDGILNTTGLQAQAWDTDILTTIRRAISKVTRLNAQVKAILVSPEVDEQLDLLKDGNGRFFGPGPWGSGVPTIWGRPRIVVPGLSGTKKFVLGDLSTCVLWDREQTTVTATDSHADFFIRNLVAILAEMRAGFGILNPSLLVAGADQAGE